MRILVLGSFVQACCWKVERLPLPGETLIAQGLSIEAGGKGLNVAIGSRRLAAAAQVDVSRITTYKKEVIRIMHFSRG